MNPIPVKEAMNMMGFQCGPCRMPLVEMSDAAKAKLKRLLEALWIDSVKFITGDKNDQNYHERLYWKNGTLLLPL